MAERKKPKFTYAPGKEWSLHRAKQIWNHLYRQSKKDSKFLEALAATESLINRLIEIQ